MNMRFLIMPSDLTSNQGHPSFRGMALTLYRTMLFAEIGFPHAVIGDEVAALA